MPNITSEFLAAVLRSTMDEFLHEIVRTATAGGHPYRASRRVARLIRRSPFTFTWGEFNA